MQYQGQRTDIVGWLSLEIAVDNTPPNTANPDDATCLHNYQKSNKTYQRSSLNEPFVTHFN